MDENKYYKVVQTDLTSYYEWEHRIQYKLNESVKAIFANSKLFVFNTYNNACRFLKTYRTGGQLLYECEIINPTPTPNIAPTNYYFDYWNPHLCPGGEYGHYYIDAPLGTYTVDSIKLTELVRQI